MKKEVIPKPLRVLVIEDVEDDYILLLRQLKQGGYSIRVESAEDFENALSDNEWDIVISDYSLPDFDGLQALEIFTEYEIDIPFILLSGAIGEDLAVSAMRAGAHDYLMKGKLDRLCPAIERELNDAISRRKRKQAEKDLEESERKFRSYVDAAPDGIFVANRVGMFIEANDSICKITGNSKNEIIRTNTSGKTYNCSSTNSEMCKHRRSINRISVHQKGWEN